MVAFTIAITSVIKHLKLKLSISKFVVKPAIATLIMSVCSYYLYTLLSGIIAGRLATIISIVFAVIIYLLAILALRIFSKQDIMSLPKGEKIYNFLEKTKIY